MAWERDYLSRKQFGQHVIALLKDRYSSSAKQNFIANLDAGWGEGKTHFIDNLANQLSDEGYSVARVNAWQDDRSADPLLTVIAAISDAISSSLPKGEKGSQLFDDAKRAIAPVAAEATKQIAKHLLKMGLGVSVEKLLEASNSTEWELDEEALSKGTDEALAALGQRYIDDAIRNQHKDKVAIQTFRDKTAAALNCLSADKRPLFVFIDELDRCRPSYAVRMLEELKHVFEIPGVVFFVATDSVQLGHSVKALYGEGFESQVYLRRFFDRVITFPPVDRAQFVSRAFESLGIDLKNDFFEDLDFSTLDTFTSLFRSRGISNRDAMQYLELVATFVHSWNHKAKIYAPYLAALTFEYFEDHRRFATSDYLMSDSERATTWKYRKSDSRSQTLHNEMQRFEGNLAKPLTELAHSTLATNYLIEEHNLRFDEISAGKQILSYLTEYRDRIRLAGRAIRDE